MMKKATQFKIDHFDFKSGDNLVGKYEVIERIGSGWEGEVYKIREISTGIDRAAKIFFPQRNVGQKASRFYARKLHKLKSCRILIQYHNEEIIYLQGHPVTVLISEYVEGELLSEFIKSFPKKRLSPYLALHLLYALCKGIEEIHLLNEYHGDLHTDNVIVNRFGLHFDIKLLDMFHWGAPTKANRDYDLCSIIQIFYDVLGGREVYSRLPDEVKKICCGLKKSLILRKFTSVSRLRELLETKHWQGRFY